VISNKLIAISTLQSALKRSGSPDPVSWYEARKSDYNRSKTLYPKYLSQLLDKMDVRPMDNGFNRYIWVVFISELTTPTQTILSFCQIRPTIKQP